MTTNDSNSLAQTSRSATETRPGRSAGHFVGGLAVLMVGIVAALLASTGAGPGASFVALVGIIAGGAWFLFGLYMLISNIDHIARKL